ncbi:conserved hypothetical protein [Ricinus communis]|uniref:Uncharacterized protein n=1 Tax=Ricinus communis TaxID=3988 RepID=B9RR47_RICCO|nr:conserved hypothetical protein [Ricinus communis]
MQTGTDTEYPNPLLVYLNGILEASTIHPFLHAAVHSIATAIHVVAAAVHATVVAIHSVAAAIQAATAAIQAALLRSMPLLLASPLLPSFSAAAPSHYKETLLLFSSKPHSLHPLKPLCNHQNLLPSPICHRRRPCCRRRSVIAAALAAVIVAVAVALAVVVSALGAVGFSFAVHQIKVKLV